MSPYDDPAVSAGEIADYLHSQQPPPMPDLLHCPFCGCVPIILPLTGRGCYIECENDACPVMLQTRTCDNAELAAAEWNTRSSEARSHAAPIETV
ncbi:hypothetical protein QMK33_19820 [Hymenobacter sp. H14-R3]|uniref:Lar family restriction alleviation protein n=1 Tax=Hymenobacter sp. H14-R3 TaxID=3046308 RepID=UPI0024BAB19A|nr:hypothetical protein [Hymenobacter sp. H14-R3]MDJ0367403.1 hypothetical protein [Hymenobacter sp. H14-R3]